MTDSSTRADTAQSRDLVATHEFGGKRYPFVVEGAVFDTHLAPLSQIFYDENYAHWLRMSAKVEEKIARGDAPPIVISLQDF